MQPRGYYRHVGGNVTDSVAMNVTVIKLGETPLLEARGDIDHNTCGSVGSALDEALAHGNDTVLFDLHDVAYIDSGGLSVLLSGVRALREHGWLGVIGPNPNVRRLLEIVGLLADPGFRVFENREAARTALAERVTP